MWHLGIDLHRYTVVIAAMNDAGEVRPAVRFECSRADEIQAYCQQFCPFRAVIEATSTYRWLYMLLSPIGTVLLAHPFRLRAMVQRRSKTDRLDAMLLAQLLRINQIPLAYVPSQRYQTLRETTRQRCRLTSAQTQAKQALRWLLARHNLQAPYKCPFGPRGLYWFRRMDFGPVDNPIRDELLERLQHFDRQLAAMDARLEELRPQYPEAAVLTELYGIGLFSALMMIAEFGDVSRFRRAKQAGAYTGLTPRVEQSGSHCYVGHISRQGSPWLRWVLLEAAMKIIHHDIGLANFYTRIRKRSSAKIARVATARKLAEICWKRLFRWQHEHSEVAVA
ncbi:MAG: IS110 family transposase [Candidatus Sulfotelmatobacter sp.]